MKKSRWMLAAIAVAGLAGAVMLVEAGPATPDYPDVACGLGPPPDAPDFAQARAREREEIRRTGFQRVCAANLARYDVTFSGGPSIPAGLAFTPLDLARTPFANLAAIGSSTESVGGIDARLYRGFRTAEGHTVTLFEHDMSANGGSMSRDPEDEPERINGLPARLVVLQAASGKAVSLLSWQEGRRYLEVWIDANVAATPLRDQLFALATALPASVPACPLDAGAMPPTLGPDGVPRSRRPALMSDADKQALMKPQRPCL